MSVSDEVKRFESPRELRSFFALGLLFIVVELWIVATLIGGEYSEKYAFEPISAQLVAVALFALGFVLSVILVMMFVRRNRYILEIGESGIRNPNRNDNWLPWDNISGLRFRPVLLRVDVAGSDSSQSAWVGIELGVLGTSLRDALTEIAVRAPKLSARQTDESAFRVRVFLEVSGVLMLTAIGYAGLGWPLALGSLVVCGTVALFGVPRRFEVQQDCVLVSYMLETTRVSLTEIEGVELGAWSVTIRRRDGQDSIRVRLGRHALDGFLAAHRAFKAVS